MTQPLSTPPRPELPPGAALEAALRGVAELRRGGTVVLAGAGGALLVLAAEHASADSLSRLRALSGGAPSLALTARRALALGYGAEPGGVVHVALAGGVTPEMVRRMADPSATQELSLPAPIKLDRVARDALPALAVALVKLARLLPAAVVAGVPAARLPYLAAWANAERLLVVEREDVEAYRHPEARGLHQVAEANVPLAGAQDARVIAFHGKPNPPDAIR